MMRGSRPVFHVNRAIDEESYQIQSTEEFYEL